MTQQKHSPQEHHEASNTSHPSATSLQSNYSTTEPPIQLWILRILLDLKQHRKLIKEHFFGSEEIAEAAGMGKWINHDHFRENRPLILKEMKELKQTLSDQYEKNNFSSSVFEKLEQLAPLAGFDELDCCLLEFFIVLNSDRILEETCDIMLRITREQLYEALGVILGFSTAEIRVALSAGSALRQSGILSISSGHKNYLNMHVDLFSEQLVNYAFSPDAEPVSILRDAVTDTLPATLTLFDFDHLPQELFLLQAHLHRSLVRRRIGTNILIYGAPGTGKTELARTLAEALERPLFEITCQDEEGEPINPNRRLGAYALAQRFFTHEGGIFLFDEIEDVFRDGRTFQASTAHRYKAWVNRILENNTVPTIWISNSLRGMDRAAIRRFDIVLRLDNPPREKRLEILRNAAGDMVDEKTLNRIADAPDLTPAVVTRATEVVINIAAELPSELPPSGAVEMLINQTLEAQNLPSLPRPLPEAPPEVYDPACIHSDTSLTDLTEGLQESRSGRICFYGPPGTGKTAFSRWLAEQLEMPLIVKRCSDLISKWVGQSERNIAKAFDEAERKGALLLIDEVDSFLHDRRSAYRSFEVSQVNEMLTQMESFTGVFIASTNLMDGLDPASLRRFDLKVKFDFLKADQTWELFKQYCAALNLTIPTEELKHRTTRLECVTPGDFAVIMRQQRFRRINSAVAFLNALEAECALKEEHKSAIGFL
jgi:transitional endoplasmic reticulum ATPase